MFNFCFIDVLADNGRLTLTGDVIGAFGKMMSAHRGEVICSVTTAQVCYNCYVTSCPILLNNYSSLYHSEIVKLNCFYSLYIVSFNQ